MHWLDTSALLVLAGVAVVGAASGSGFVRPAMKLAAITLAAVAAALLSPLVADVLSARNGAPVSPTLIVGLTFVAILVVLSVAAVLIRRLFWQRAPDSVLDIIDGLRWLDRLAGAVTAAALAAAVLAVIVYAADQNLEPPERERLEGSATLRHSRARVAAAIDALSDRQKAQFKDVLD